MFHFNDYPAEPPRSEISDAQRVYPGDGIARWAKLLRTLRNIGFRGAVSLELFNREYWNQDALLVAHRAGKNAGRGAEGPVLATASASRPRVAGATSPETCRCLTLPHFGVKLI